MDKDSNTNLAEPGLQLDPKTMAVFHKKGYSLEKKLAEGAFGQVFKGKATSTGELVAIKVMFMEKLDHNYANKFWPRELSALISIRHDNVVAVYDIFRSGGKLFIFMEFANGGDLTGYLDKHGVMAEPLAAYWFTQCSRAMQYMHYVHHFAHRDIKLDNVLLHNNRAKMTDFGFARCCWDDTNKRVELSSTMCGTAPYYSPQIVQGHKYNPLAADAYAMGIMLFAMLNNRYPFVWDDEKLQFQQQNDPNFFITKFRKPLSNDAVDLMRKLLAVEEKKRYNLNQVLEHPWVLSKGKSVK